MLNTISKNWWVLLLRGLWAIAVGVMAIIWPALTVLVLIYMFAAYAVVDAIMALMIGFHGKPNGRIWWEMIVIGVVGLIAGIGAFAWPGLTAVMFLYMIAGWAIFRGVLEIAAAISLRKVIDDEWVLGLSGLLSIAFGALMLKQPGEGALAIVLLIGGLMIAGGIMAIALSMRLRKLHTALQKSSTA